MAKPYRPISYEWMQKKHMDDVEPYYFSGNMQAYSGLRPMSPKREAIVEREILARGGTKLLRRYRASRR